MTNFFVYDEAGRKTFETNANRELIRYTNNAAGDLLSLTDGKIQTTRWNYDQYGRVTNKLDQSGIVVLRYQYADTDNPLSRKIREKGSTHSLVHFGWLLSWQGYEGGMPRKLRLQYPGARHHVMSRGDRSVSPVSVLTLISVRSATPASVTKK